MPKNKNKYGQYFTIDSIAQFMVDLIQHDKDARILEPSCGKGVFLTHLEDKGYKNISAYEIDRTLDNPYSYVKYESFISAPIQQTDVVIGNPPYIRWKNLEDDLKEELNHSVLWQTYFNSLCDYLFIFILKSIEHLVEGGELIFICTEYWLNTTHSQSLRDYMSRKGYISEIYHFKEASLFEGVCASFIVFRYVKTSKRKNTLSLFRFNDTAKPSYEVLSSRECFSQSTIPQFKPGERWLLATQEQQIALSHFEERCTTFDETNLFSTPRIQRIGEFCDIGNGMVSGLDKAFNVSGLNLNKDEEENTISVLKAKDLEFYTFSTQSKYFFLQENVSPSDFQVRFPNIFQHLKPFYLELNKRYNYGREIPYWEFVFPRNYNLFSRKEERIFVPCKERISNKSYFRFVLAPAGFFPLQDVTGILRKPSCRESVEYLLAYLNNERVFTWLGFNGIVKGYIVEFSEAPIASIPFRCIDWNNKEEVDIHDQITKSVRKYISTRDISYIERINSLFNLLFI